MFTLRCTQKLLKRFKTKPNENPPPNTTVMGDWYADLIHLNRRPTLLMVNEPSRLALVMTASPQKTFHERFLIELQAQLEHAQIGAHHIQVELHEMRGEQNITFAKTQSRSVLGNMVDYRNVLSAERNEDLRSRSRFLAKIISSPIDYNRPKDVALSLFPPGSFVH